MVVVVGNLDLSQPGLAAARLPTTHIPPLPLSICAGNQHSFVKAN